MNATMTRGLVDLGSLIWTSLLAGKDVEHGQKVMDETGKGVLVNSAQYGYDNALAYLLDTMKTLKLVPTQLILVPDGMNSKLYRANLMPTYKAGRSRVPQAYEQFNLVKGMLTRQLLDVGAMMAWTDGGLEADDVIGYLARNLEGIRWIISADKDLAQLVGPGPKDRLNAFGKVANLYPGVDLGLDDSAWTGYVHHFRRGVIDENPFGPFPHRYISTAIALVGDTSDKIPGAKGFGDKALAELVALFGDDGLELMEALIKGHDLHRLAEDVGSMKKLQKVIDDADSVYLSYQLGRLHDDKINPMTRPLKWKVGLVKPPHADTDPLLKPWAAHYSLVTAENYDHAYAAFERQMRVTPDLCLDLETTVGEESDEWLARRTAKGGGVDVIGSRITGTGISFGANGQHQFYLQHNHVEEPAATNLSHDQMRRFLDLIPKDKVTVAHNAAGFELPVLYNHFGQDWKDNGWRGMFPNMVDSRIALSYWDEDQMQTGLKAMSKLILDYEQETYAEVTQRKVLADEWDGRGKMISQQVLPIHTGEFGTDVVVPEHLDDEGGLVAEYVCKGTEIIDYENGPAELLVEYKMHELTGAHVLSYGLDDTTTAHALWRFARAIMETEGTLEAFFRLEVKPTYLTALGYVQGIPVSLEHLGNLSRADDAKYEAHKVTLDTELTRLGWDGTVCPRFDTLDRAAVLEAFQVINGTEIKSLNRTLSKLAKVVEDAGDPVLAQLVAENDVDSVNAMMARKFQGAPRFDVASPKQVSNLIYTVLGLPVRLRNKVTKVMREKGIKEGTARTDDDAIKMAQKMDVKPGTAEHALLTALMEMKSINTKRGLYYVPYPNAVHWSTRRIHPELIQSSTNTRRWASRNPNVQQLDSEPGGIRSCIVPHHRNAVVVSLDESAQEVRLAADYSQDKNLLSCYLGTKDQLRDVHSIIACRIAGCSYEEFRAGLLGADAELAGRFSKIRGIAKVVLFATLYGAMAPKIAEGLGIKEQEAQEYIDAIYSEYAGLPEWKEETEAHANKHGWVPITGGTRRHLARQLLSSDRYESSKALRQASNASIQGAGANQIKEVMSKVWDSDLLDRYDMQWYMPVHDEVVFSVNTSDAPEVIRRAHGFMTDRFLNTVPSASSIGFGRDFGRLKEIGEVFSEEKVAAGVAGLFEQKVAA
jgi:5'-3' exonuclease